MCDREREINASAFDSGHDDHHDGDYAYADCTTMGVFMTAMVLVLLLLLTRIDWNVVFALFFLHAGRDGPTALQQLHEALGLPVCREVIQNERKV